VVDGGQAAARLGNLLRQEHLARLPLLVEAFGVGLVRQPAFDDGDALPRIGDAVHVHAQREAVEELGPQVAFLRVHRADQHEPRGVAETDAFALDHIDAHRGGVEQQVNDVVIKQVDLIHVQQPAIRRSQHARLEVPLAVLDGLLDVQRAHDSVFRRADGQVDEAGAPGCHGQRLAAGQPVAAVVAEGVLAVRLAREGTVRHHLNLGQQGCQGPRGGGFGRAALAANEHPADAAADGIQDEGPLHLVLAHDGCKGIRSNSSHE